MNPSDSSSRIASPWQLLLTPPLSGVENMAIDAAMLDRAKARQVTIARVYSWVRPTLSLGRHQRARGCYDPELLRARGADVVRRPTGGRAILHWREVTYSVAAPIAAAETLRDAYRRINSLLIETLRELGVAVEAAAVQSREMTPGPAPCFDHPSEGELVADGGKLVGSAQWREEGGYLQHGSILVDDDQSSILDLMQEPIARPPRPATLRGLTGRHVTPQEVAEAFFGAIRRRESKQAVDLSVTDLEGESSRWVRHFSNDEWTWRR